MQAKKIKFLLKREIEMIEKVIERNYGAKIDLSRVAVAKTSVDKLWLLSKQIKSFDLLKLKINVLGLYFGRLKLEKIRLSIEGCQLVGKYARRNFVILSKDEAEGFAKGYDVGVEKAVDCEEGNFVLVKCGNNLLGTGKFYKNRVKNLTPRSRRITPF
ncbi:MAG: hypothetical protein QMD14_02090 [Candidatus Aenigmarchaeota archaeon]|nr:hypothetical protein [Candidatus Aenigmarchaeota archaeon]